MLRLARAAVARPVLALVLATMAVGALAAIGVGISGSLSPSVTIVPRTESSRAQHLADAQFGPSVLVPILLEGPAAQLDRQGPALVRALDRRPDTRVLSAWDGGASGRALRPRRNAAMVVAAVAATEDRMVATRQAQLDALVARTVSAPVHASITGQPTIDRALRDRSIDTARTTILIALGVLLLVLVLVLRAPVAALLVTLLAAGTAYGALGLTALAARVTDVDAIAVLLGTMTALVLGSGYGVLIHRRWAAVAATGPLDASSAALAAADSVRTAGRGVLIGGTALVLADVVADLLGPTAVLTSLFITSTLSALLAIGAAVVVMPAALTLLGARASLWSFGLPRPLGTAWARLADDGERVVVRDAIVVGAIATVLLGLLALGLSALRTGPPSAAYLPSGDPARVAYERVATVMGPGWPTPFNIVYASRRRPITDRDLLLQVNGFQRDIARDRRVASVVGPGAFAATSTQLDVLPRSLRSSARMLRTAPRDLGRLATGLGQAGAGVRKLRSGLSAAAGGAQQLQNGSTAAQGGAGQLHAGLATARSGAAQVAAGLDAALSGARRLRTGAAQALSGSQRITGGLGTALKPVRAGAPVVKQLAADVAATSATVTAAAGTAAALGGQLDEASAAVRALPDSPQRTQALAALGTAHDAAGNVAGTLAGTSDRLKNQAAATSAFAGQVAQLSTGLSQLYAGSTELTSGIGRLRSGNAELATGIAKLAGGGGQLTTGVTRLRDGAAQLETGLGQLSGGAGQLASGLSSGVGPSGRLITGLGTAQSKVTQFRSTLPSAKDLQKLQAQSPGLFDSGYFVLAAIAGAPATARNQASFAVNLARGGTAGQITVISRYAAGDARTVDLGEDLVTKTDDFAHASGTAAAVGGPAGALGDFSSAATDRLWLVVAGIALTVAVLLMVMLRAVLLPLVAVAFDLLGVAATLGVVAVLFSGTDPLLGGPGTLDPVTIIAAVTATFGMTIVYEVQLLARTREAFAATGDARGALRFGLDQTAGAATGAAAVMIAAIVPFALSDLAVARQLGVAAIVVVLLDAFVIRPALLPAAIAVLGRSSWWPTARPPHPAARGERQRSAVSRHALRP